jgi:hypothetical protein
MALKAFKREGLRRDKNLSDLPSPKTALNNILSTPQMLGTDNESFTVDDLAPIQNIYITNITSSTFATLNGVTLEFTIIDTTVNPPEIKQDSNPKPFLPLVKIKNRLDTAYFSTGEPFFFGGDGPDATYYDASNIVRNPEGLTFDVVYDDIRIIKSGNNLYRTSDGAQRTAAQGALTHLASGGVVDGFTFVGYYKEYEPYLNPALNPLTLEDDSVRDNFWERGQFVYGNKVQASFISLFGGVNWQGMFKSTEPGYARFFLRTSGSTVFKFQHPDYPSYSEFRYGKVDYTWEANNGTFSAGGSYLSMLNTILSDPSRRFIKVVCNDNVQLQTDDVIYLEINEGPLAARQYQIYGLTAKDVDAVPQDPSLVSGQTIFFVEATTDFNLNNVNYDDIPTLNDPTNTASGYKGIARYFPWERRPYKTYFNSTKHKFSIDPSDFNITGANTIQFDITDESSMNIYRSIFVEDYIYDYRRRSADTTTEGEPPVTVAEYTVRRFRVTGCNDSNKSISVEIDPSYNAIQTTDTNDQRGYVDALSGQLKFDGTVAERINSTRTTGNINDTIDTGTGAFTDPLLPNTPTQTLYYVARYGDSVVRYRYFVIEQFLERAVDYAIDWTYFTKDEDVSATSSEKAWVLWYRNETSADYGPLNYKHLYAKDYEFYEIGDFKRFLENSVLLYGTSRENGIEQRAFGKPKLVEKGDQYNLMYSLLPIKSEYDPPLNFQAVATSMTGSIADGSRAISVSDQASIIEGNYIFDNSSVDTIINGSSAFGYRGRVIEKLFSTSLVITSKLAQADATSTTLYAVDHQGFITALKITGGTGNSWNFEGDGSEVKIGHVIVTPSENTRATYVRIVKVDYNSGAQTGTMILDTSISTPTLVLVYYDRGIDITKPLAAFCTDSGCGQHAYSGDTTDTQFIAIKATSNTSSNGSLDTLISANSANVQTLNNNNSIVQWLLENNMGDVTQSNYTNGIFKNSVVTVKWDGMNAATAATEKGAANMSSNTYYPMGTVKGLVKIAGKPWEGSLSGNEYSYYWIVRLSTNWQSNAAADQLPQADTVPGAGDGFGTTGLNYNVSFNPRSFAGSAWNVKDYNVEVINNNNGYLSQDGNISSSGDLDNTQNAGQENSGLNGYKTIGVNITLTTAQQAYFENLESITPLAPSSTYVLTTDMYIRRMTSGGKFWIFKDFNDIQDTHTVWGNNSGSTSSVGNADDDRVQQLIYLHEQQGPVKVTGSSLSDNFRYLHYRRKQYEVVPINQNVEDATTGHLRLVNFNATTSALVDNVLGNTTNKLSVFTFANTTDNRELCCPPLDTSPPFDSSPIGLSTTALEPDMSMGGLANVRSINGDHPEDEIFPIPDNKDNGNSFDSSDITGAPVNRKFQVMFNGVKYNMLLSDTNPVG